MHQARSIDVAESHGGYIWIENRFIEKVLPKLSGNDVRIYLCLVRNVPQNDEADPLTPYDLSQAKIGKDLTLSRKSVNRATKRLEENSATETIRVAGYTNRYLLLGVGNGGETRRIELVKGKGNRGFTWIANTCVNTLLELNGTVIKVYLYVARWVNQKSKEQLTLWPLFQAKIAKDLNLHRSTVNKALRILDVEHHLIEKVTTPGRAIRYRLLETCEVNTTGDVKEILQGSNENPTPPVNESLQVNSANRCEASARDTPKSTSKNKKRNLKKRKGKLVSLKTALEEYVASWGENDS